MKNPFIKNGRTRLQDKITIEKSFKLNGKQYWTCASATELAAGRGLTAMIIYDEFRMRCSKEYLEIHIRATSELLAGRPDGKVTLDHLLTLKQINANLQERLNLVAMPDYVFKLCSVYYWDDSESPYYYDWEYNQKKIAEWKKTPEALAFFLTQPLKEFLPFTELPLSNALSFLDTADRIDQLTQGSLQEILSKNK